MKKIFLISLLAAFITPAWAEFTYVNAGGYGGNPLTGVLTYDGTPAHLPSFIVSRGDNDVCYLINDHTRIASSHGGSTFDCRVASPTHQGLYWNGNFGAFNEANSPANDVMFASSQLFNMFKDWYDMGDNSIAELDLPVRFYLQDGEASYINYDKVIELGLGGDNTYPHTTLTTVSSLLSKLYFAESDRDNHLHSNQPSSFAFNLITAMAVEYYTTGKNTWVVGKDIAKNNLAPVHYLDQPSKNGVDIDTYAEYTPGMSPDNASGLYSRAFYTLATTNNWNTRKAYAVFLHAKIYHWENNPDFHQAACDIVYSANELGYDTYSVMLAFSVVGIDTRDCSVS